jgi:hypothetical protein
MKLMINYTALGAALITLFLAPGARAACAAGGAKAWFSSSALSAKAAAALRLADDNPFHLGNGDSIVGLWDVTLLLGDGPTVYDRGFEQWHADGTELLVDTAVPPSLGNVCVGVYKQTGPRSYKLRHVTWNWDLAGNLTGSFLLQMTVTIDKRGSTLNGNYVTDSFDLDGNVIPSLHAEGVVQGSRITVN